MVVTPVNLVFELGGEGGLAISEAIIERTVALFFCVKIN